MISTLIKKLTILCSWCRVLKSHCNAYNVTMYRIWHDQICLSFSALYSEPRLSIHINSSAFIVKFETEGFPKPEVNWLSKQGENLTHQLEVIDLTEDGLYFIKSSYVAQRQIVNVTFTLKNHLLNQNLERPVILIYGKKRFFLCIECHKNRSSFILNRFCREML